MERVWVPSVPKAMLKAKYLSYTPHRAHLHIPPSGDGVHSTGARPIRVRLDVNVERLGLFGCREAVTDAWVVITTPRLITIVLLFRERNHYCMCFS